LLVLAATLQNKKVITMESNDSKVGFVSFAETWNGRLAMLGFVIGIATELLTGQGILSQIGLM
jgi:Chlorophyll A-B binding protein